MENITERKPNTWLIYGHSGWIGGHLLRLLEKKNRAKNSQEHPIEVVRGEARLENRERLVEEIRSIRPTYVVNAAGVTGRPNVDWCEDNVQATIRGNVLAPVNLADVCFLEGETPCVVFASGCIYEYEEEGKGPHTVGSGIGFREEDEPNYHGSVYSRSKIAAEKLIADYPNVLVLRLRMPISDDFHPRSFLTKITRYERVVDVPNSMTLLHDLLPLSLDMIERGRRGVYNFTNPGTISHNELLGLYKKHIDPDFVWTNFGLDDQAKILKASRSNNELDCTKLRSEYPQLKNISEAVVDLFERMQRTSSQQ